MMKNKKQRKEDITASRWSAPGDLSTLRRSKDVSQTQIQTLLPRPHQTRYNNLRSWLRPYGQF
jgi:hypothetical protein